MHTVYTEDATSHTHAHTHTNTQKSNTMRGGASAHRKPAGDSIFRTSLCSSSESRVRTAEGPSDLPALRTKHKDMKRTEGSLSLPCPTSRPKRLQVGWVRIERKSMIWQETIDNSTVITHEALSTLAHPRMGPVYASTPQNGLDSVA